MDRATFQADDCSPLTDAVSRGEVELISLGRGQYPGRRLSPKQLPGLRTVGYWNAVGVQTWGLPMHRNEGIEICYLLSGETSFATDSQEWMLRPGDMTITRPWQRHRLGNPLIRACKLFWMILDVETNDGRAAWEFPSWIGPDAESRRDLLRILRQNQRCHFHDENQHLKKFMSQACRNLDDDGPFTMARIANLINHLMLHVTEGLSLDIEASQGDPQGFDRTIREFFFGLEASVEKAAEPWTVAQMAHACRVGVTYLTASCKEIFNATPSEQLNRIRLFHGANALKADPSRLVTDIALSIGFNTSQYFATRFRKHFGVSPQEYRSRQNTIS